jgi:RHS repeat-associated protein
MIMKNYIQKFAFKLALIILVFSFNRINAQSYVFNNWVSGTPITGGANFTVIDDKFTCSPFPACNNDIEIQKEITNLVTFEIDKDNHKVPTQSLTYTANVTIELWDGSNSPSGVPDNVLHESLEIIYDSDYSLKSGYRAVFHTTGYYKMKVTVNSITTSGGTFNGDWPPLKVYGEIFSSRLYDFDPNFLVVGPSPGIIETFDSKTVTWYNIPGAQEYDLEWTFYDNSSSMVDRLFNDSQSYLDFSFLFQNNATRVTLAENSFKIPLLYPNGWVFYRFRGKRINADGKMEFTRWSSKLILPIQIIDYVYKIDVGSHEPDLNWQSQLTFAEEGKNIPAVKYFDGSLRERQNVTFSNAIQTSIAGQTIYDQQGRPALSLMPAPTFDAVIRYNPLLASKDASTVYDFQHFEKDDCEGSPDAMFNNNGAARYYSPNNPDIANKPTKYVPDSEGFPFSITEYTPDLTGRIKRQSGVGSVFKLGSGKETKYLYGKPTTKELDRLFGNEVGVDSHYQKNIVIDPNGQVSVSYLDAHGRTIATALSGSNPEKLDALPNITNPAGDEANLLNNQKDGNKLISIYALTVTEEGAYDFEYDLVANDYQPDCLDASNICYECVYDLKITISDDCNNSFNESQTFERVAATNVPDLICGNPLGILQEEFDFPMLEPGSYFITKELSVNQGVLEYYLDDFLTHEECVPSLEDLTTFFQSNLDFSGCEFDCEECETLLGDEQTFINNSLQFIYDLGGTPTQEDYDLAEDEFDNLLAECQALCDFPTECDRFRYMMRNDVTPGSQYATYEIDGNGNFVVNDPYSIFYNNAYKTITYYYYHQGVNTGQIIYVDINGESKAVSTLEKEEFIRYWDPEWAYSLVENFHPEYQCVTDWCTENEASDDYDKDLFDFNSIQDAINAGFLDENFNFLNDPFFSPGNPGANYVGTFYEWMLDPDTSSCTPISIYNIIMISLNCGNPTTMVFGEGGPGDLEIQWNVLRGIYLGFKQQIKADLLADNSKFPNCNTADVLCIGDPNCSNQDLGTKNKVISFSKAPEPSSAQLIAQKNLKLGDIQDFCESNCEAMADGWMAMYEACISNQTQYDDLRQGLIDVCKLGCDENHPFGASTTPSGITTANGDASFEDVFIRVLGIQSQCDLECNPYAISFPGSYENPIYLGPSTTPVTCEGFECACERLTDFEECYNNFPNGYTNFSDFLTQFSPVRLSQDKIDAIFGFCSAEDQLNPPVGITIPPYLECGVCKTCDEVSSLVNYFETNICLNTSMNGYEEILTRYLNFELGFNLTSIDYEIFFEKCQMVTPVECVDNIVLCPNVTVQNDADPCRDDLLLQAESHAIIVYETLLENAKNSFIEGYTSTCMNNDSESFKVNKTFREYQYTLYYYDQAGNLVKTIPPNGVNPLTSVTDLQAVENHRLDPVNYPNPTYPSHTFATNYRYNSLNQITKQKSPDAGEVKYWYDKVGRLVVSQDGRQGFNYANKYSYTIYDDLGRVIEVGEKTNITVMNDVIARNSTSLKNWLEAGSADSKKYVTRTFYSSVEIPDVTNSFGSAGQENLRNRVAHVTFEEVSDGDQYIETYDYATHYSYDAVGNVKTLIQDIPELESIGHRFKRIDYDYDFVSGKVNKVLYQKDSTDQFVHFYDYDEDNRLVEVKTSQVSLNPMEYLWESEARYDYYLHGPLSRIELGDRQIQGLDYAYTLQGWMKVMNRNYFHQDLEMGADGQTNGSPKPHQYVARDNQGFALSYFSQDYSPIGVTGSANPEIAYLSTDLDTYSSDLFNGNIRNMSYFNMDFTNNKPNGYIYKYDQLNRITKMDTWSNVSTNSWNTGGAALKKYGLEVSYDPNGNISALKRRGSINTSAGELMDDLIYSYEPGTNKLNHVHDNVPSAKYTMDIDGQLPDNYAYDNSGNLTNDIKEGSIIAWTPYGKVESIDLGSGKVTLFEYDAMQNRIKKEVNNGEGSIVTTYYIRDAQGNVMATYERTSSSNISWKEQYIYGSARIGSWKPDLTWTTNKDLDDSPYFWNSEPQLYQGWKTYEVTNHLGNVLSVLSDRKEPNSMISGVATSYNPVVIAAKDYYPFGMEMEGRSNALENYRYGFNGKEADRDEWGSLTQYDYGFRIYNPAIGKFLSVDPLTASYPMLTPYQFASNRPIDGIDLDGLEYYYFMNQVVDEVGNTKWDLVKTQDVIEMQTGIGPVTFNLSKYGIVGHFGYYDDSWRLIPERYVNQSLNNITDGEWKSFTTIEEIESRVAGGVAIGRNAENAVNTVGFFYGIKSIINGFANSSKILNSFRSVSKRHRGINVGQKSLARNVNTVYDETVNVAKDRQIINSGNASLVDPIDGNRVYQLTNGRKYIVMNDELVPLSGPGIYTLNRAQYKILGTYNELGLERGGEIIRKIGYDKVDVTKALDAYNSIQKSK